MSQVSCARAPERAVARWVVAHWFVVGLPLVSASDWGMAQQQEVGRPATLPSVTVSAPAEGSLTVPAVDEQRRATRAVAGGVDWIDMEDHRHERSFTLRDLLQDSPGVFVQTRYGQESRLSVRGSGLARAYHTRGIEILQDGVPTNLADGSGDFYQIDPLALRSIEVYRGANGLIYGASAAGGAINFVTPTARTATGRAQWRLEGGSFGTWRTAVQASRILERADLIATASMTGLDGDRQHSAGRYAQFNGNFGYRISPDLETRFYAGVHHVDQQLPGSLSLSDALQRPRMAAVAALAGDQSRETRTERLANLTRWRMSWGVLDVSSWYIHKTLFHPIFQVLDQSGDTYGLSPRLQGEATLAGMRHQWTLGARLFNGFVDARQYVNDAGMRGAQTASSVQKAANLDLWFEDRLWIGERLALVVGAKAYRSRRDYRDPGGLPSDPQAYAASRRYQGINPKLGLLWQPAGTPVLQPAGTPVSPPAQDQQWFITLSRSADLPDFTDLNQTIGATRGFVPLAPQKGWTLEAGTRGASGRLAWNATAYASWVRDQLLQYVVDPSIPASTFNADRTRLLGIEAWLQWEALRNLAGPRAGDRLLLSMLWNYSDFRFVDDRRYGDHRIAGVPMNVLRAQVAYRQRLGWSLSAALDWVPAGAWADQSNTLRVPGYALLGATVAHDFANGLTLFVEGRNLTDKRYISDIGTLADARAANTSVFYPGQRRAVYAGMRMLW